MKRELLNTLDNAVIDFMFTFEDFEEVCRSIDISAEEVSNIKDGITSKHLDLNNERDLNSIIKIVNYTEENGIPLRSVGLEITTYGELKKVLAQFLS